jgi:cytochrome c peroxidase
MPAHQPQDPQSASEDAKRSNFSWPNCPSERNGTAVRRQLIGKTMLTIAVVVAWLAAAAGGQTPAANQGALSSILTPRNVNTPCDGVDLDATRRYNPTLRADGHVEFPVGSLSFPVPASLPVTTGASGNGKVKFTFSLSGDTPTTCVYRGDGWNTYNFVQCAQAPLPYGDRDDDDGDHDDGPGDPLPVAGTIVTADSFTLHINKGDKTAGTTTVHLHLDGPTEFIPAAQALIANAQIFANPNGSHATYSTRGGGLLDTDNAFFQPLGTNGRACVTCHQPEDAMGISAVHVQRRFESSCGLEPLFRPVDGSNNPTTDVSTMANRRDAYSLLLNKGLIRVELPVPPNAQFDVIAVDDPYGNSTRQPLPLTQISVFRRPLPATNLKFLGAISAGAPPSAVATPGIMWDGRETQPNPFIALMNQANNATLTHAEAGAALSPGVLSSIVDFVLSLFTAQEAETAAGSVSVDGANGGTLFLSTVPFTVGENRAPNPIRQDVFHLFDLWASQVEQRDSIARGQALFNFREGINPLSATCATNVPNDCSPGAQPGAQAMTCTRCHSTFETGGQDGGSFGNSIANSIGNFTSGGLAGEFRTPDLPLYTLRQKAAQNAIRMTTDPGRALITGVWADVNKFKAPSLRGLAGRAPYFHNGSAPTLEDVIDAYQAAGFQFNFTAQERADIVAFLKSL